MKLIFANLFEPQLVGWLAKVLAELVDMEGVRVDRTLGKITNLHVLYHALDERVHSILKRSHKDDPQEKAVTSIRRKVRWISTRRMCQEPPVRKSEVHRK